MKYALNLGDDGRVLSSTFARYAHDGAQFVDALPDGDLSQYRYVDGAFVLDPLQQPEEPEEQPTEELLLELAADHEYRICLIELGVNEDDL